MRSCVTQITVELLHNSHLMGTEESGHCGEVVVMGKLGCYMFFFCAKFMLTVSHSLGNPIIYTL